MNRFATAMVKTPAKVPVKIKISFCIFIYAVVMACVKRRIDGIFCLIAVIFCFAGDVALNHRKNHNEQTSKDFKIGMIMFMIAHVLYSITYYARMLNEYPQVVDRGCNWLVFLVVDVFLILTITETIGERLDFGKYEFAIILYMAVISTSFSMTFCYANIAKSISSLACVGGAALVISDLIIAIEKFAHYKTQKTRVMVWVTYIVGQILMITFA